MPAWTKNVAKQCWKKCVKRKGGDKFLESVRKDKPIEVNGERIRSCGKQKKGERGGAGTKQSNNEK